MPIWVLPTAARGGRHNPFASLVFLAAATPLVPSAAASDLPAPPQGESRPRLEILEDLSESLANDVLELSAAVRERDRSGSVPYFAETVAAEPFPSKPGPLDPKAKWISERTWAPAPPARSAALPRVVGREAYLAEWWAYLDHFSEIEDLRFKIRGATFADDARSVAEAKVPTAVPGARGEARVRFWLVGRDEASRREWAVADFEAKVSYPSGGPWRFEAITNVRLASKVASTDLFSEVSEPAGVAERISAYGTPANGGFAWKGAAAGDIDGDGWIDLFVTAGTRNHLYLNRGDGTFRDASAEAGVDVLATGTAPLLLDHDGDGDLDVFIAAVGTQVLLESQLVPDRKLAFQDASQEHGVAVPAVGFSAAAADVNRDGRPDIYVCSYNHYGRVTPDSWSAATNGTPNLFFVSQPDGGYREEAHRWGLADRRWSYAAAFADLDEDGQLDLYVANDFGEKGLFMRRGDRFVDEAGERGALDPGNGMGVSVADYNNDGHLDLHVTNMSSTAGNRILGRLFPGQKPEANVLVKLAAGNNVYENLGGGRFRDVTAEVGGLSAQWAWGGGFVDFDNDGLEDVFSPNGFVSGKSMKDT
jgi:hypothetical protein